MWGQVRYNLRIYSQPLDLGFYARGLQCAHTLPFSQLRAPKKQAGSQILFLYSLYKQEHCFTLAGSGDGTSRRPSPAAHFSNHLCLVYNWLQTDQGLVYATRSVWRALDCDRARWTFFPIDLKRDLAVSLLWHICFLKTRGYNREREARAALFGLTPLQLLETLFEKKFV